MASVPRREFHSVPDPDGELYDEMLRQENAKQARAEAGGGQPRRSVGHPGFAESLIPVWGSGREAVADFQEGDYVGAAINGGLAASDVFMAGALVKGLAKGGLVVASKGLAEKGYAWRNVRKEMENRGLIDPGQHGHHWAIPQSGWGKNVPNVIKNQPWNIKPMPSAEVHGRITNSYKGKPRFDVVERYVYGTPTGAKVATGAAIGHPLAGGAARRDD